MPDHQIGGNASLHLVVKIHDHLMANLQGEYRAAELGTLSPTHGGILAALASAPALTMRELAERTNRDKSTVTALCQKLEALGFMERRGDPADLRLARATLTADGKKAAQKIRRAAQKQAVALHRALDAGERAHLNALLQKWLQAMED